MMEMATSLSWTSVRQHSRSELTKTRQTSRRCSSCWIETAMASSTPPISSKCSAASLRKKLNGVPVLKSEGGGKFLVDNSKLKAEAPFLAFRRSKKLDDRVTDIVGPEWGSVVQAEDAGEWIKVQQKVNRLSYKAFLGHICDMDANQSKSSTKR